MRQALSVTWVVVPTNSVTDERLPANSVASARRSFASYLISQKAGVGDRFLSLTGRIVLDFPGFSRRMGWSLVRSDMAAVEIRGYLDKPSRPITARIVGAKLCRHQVGTDDCVPMSVIMMANSATAAGRGSR